MMATMAHYCWLQFGPHAGEHNDMGYYYCFIGRYTLIEFTLVGRAKALYSVTKSGIYFSLVRIMFEPSLLPQHSMNCDSCYSTLVLGQTS